MTFAFEYGSDNMEEFQDCAPITEWTSGLYPGQPIKMQLNVARRGGAIFEAVQRCFCPISLINDYGKIVLGVRLNKKA